MRESDAQTVLLVKAFEEADPEGRVFPLEERNAALKGGTAGFEETLARRASGLLERLEERFPQLPRLLQTTRLGAGLAPVLTLSALVLGLLGNSLGPQRHINVLSFPLLSLIAWNLGVYLLLVLEWCRSRSSHQSPRRQRSSLAQLLSEAYGRLSLRRFEKRSEHSATVFAAAIGRFLTQWRRVAAPLIEVRARRLLHLGAAALAIGAVAGMYFRGLAFEYRATWESTFLGTDQAQALLEAVLWPASRLLGETLPDLDLLRAPLDGEAAPWVHLYGMSALLYIVAPRLLLATLVAKRCRRLARNLPLDLGDSYYRRAAALAGSQTSHVQALPYSMHPAPDCRARLEAVLPEVLGCRVEVELARMLEYGAEAQEVELPHKDPPTGGGTETHLLVLFSLSQSPETEVHGRLLQELRERQTSSGQLLVAVIASEYRARMTEIGAPERVEERRRSWDRVVARAGLEAIHLDLEAADSRGLGGPQASSFRFEANPQEDT